MEEISKASVFIDSKFVIDLDYPKFRKTNGEIIIDCYIINKNHGYEDDIRYYKELNDKFNGKLLTIRGRTPSGTKIALNKAFMSSCSHPSFEFSFTCLDYKIEHVLCDENSKMKDFGLSSLIIEGIEVLFTNTSEIKRERFMFGENDSRILTFKLDNTELNFEFFNKKRYFNFNIGLIDIEDSPNSLLVKFYGDKRLPYRIYHRFKKSINYFISYLAGNNVIIREENFTIKHQEYITKRYSNENLLNINKNQFLPVFDVHFRHDRILQNYLNSLPNYLLVDKHLDLSEIVYLVNQSKHVNMESSFFILLIAIEKLATNLMNSDLIEIQNNYQIDDDLFQKLKPELLSTSGEVFKSNGLSKKQIEVFKTKIGNLNLKNKTDNKIDVLLDFCEIKRTEEIDLLFSKLRNLAIHEGEISFSNNEAHKNYETLFILVNNLICNLIQYKGTRFLRHDNKTNYITKKETYKIDYKKYDKNSFPQ